MNKFKFKKLEKRETKIMNYIKIKNLNPFSTTISKGKNELFNL